MKARMPRCAWAIALLCLWCPSRAWADDAAWPTLTRTINAGTEALRASLQVSEGKREDGSTIELLVMIDLSPIRQRVVSDRTLLQDNCRSYSVSNYVAEGESVELTVEDGKLKIERRGRLSVWQCIENPVPNSKVEWEIKSVGLGIKTKVPVVKTWPGSPIKNKLAEQSYASSTSFAFDQSSSGTIAVQAAYDGMGSLLAPSDAKKDLEETTRRATENVKGLLEKIVSPETLLAVLPAEYRGIKLSLKSAAFSAQGSDPTVRLAYETRLSAAEADAFKKSLLALPLYK
ncbi:hypothetical protein GPL17_19155 [Bradyrhizobium yuanmingense]|nr:hypothetical protein [Bradyrhizobium yuanmingense]